MLTKDDISDLKSLIQRAEQTAIELKNAEQAKRQADTQLESFLYKHTQQIVNKDIESPKRAYREMPEKVNG